jgi:hypothetical protein
MASLLMISFILLILLVTTHLVCSTTSSDVFLVETDDDYDLMLTALNVLLLAIGIASSARTYFIP